jgi:putative long chain acyl-CoA synthase
VRLAAYDVAAGRLRERPDGFAVPCRTGEVGMLLTRVRGVVTTSESPLRGLFEPDDAWHATGDLFRADHDGDLWLIDNVAALIRTDHGHVAGFPIMDALGDVEAIDLAVVYGVDSLAVAAMTVRDGFELDPGQVGEVLDVLAEDAQPDLVQVVDEIPVTTWYRPNTSALRESGLPPDNAVIWRRVRRNGE